MAAPRRTKRISALTTSLLREGESERCDFKRAPEGISTDDLVAFANSEEGGSILAGVDERAGPGGTQVGFVRGLKTGFAGEIAVSGPELARSLTDLGLIDEYRLYFHPVVLGRGKPFFAGPRPPLRLVASDLMGEDVIRLTYVPA